MLGLKARLLSAKRCQVLRAGPLAFCIGPATAFSAMLYKKPNPSPGDEEGSVGSQGWMTSFHFPVGHPSDPECRKDLGNGTIHQAADKVHSFPRVQLHFVSQDFQSLEQEDRKEASAGSGVLLK